MKYPKIRIEDDARRKLFPDDIARIKELKKKGRSYAEIARLFNVSNALIHYHTRGENYKIEHNRKICERIKLRGHYPNQLENSKRNKRKRRSEELFKEYQKEQTIKWYSQDEKHKAIWREKSKLWRNKTNYNEIRRIKYRQLHPEVKRKTKPLLPPPSKHV